MKYEITIDGNTLKTDDKDVALEFIKAMARPIIPYVPPIVIERDVYPISPTWRQWELTCAGGSQVVDFSGTLWNGEPTHLVTKDSFTHC